MKDNSLTFELDNLNPEQKFLYIRYSAIQAMQLNDKDEIRCILTSGVWYFVKPTKRE